METFHAIWLDKSVFLSGNSHLLGGDYSIRKNKIAANSSVVSGRCKRGARCENLGQITFNETTKKLRNMIYKKIEV